LVAVRIIAVLAAITALPPASFFAWWYSGSIRGDIAARFDVAQGHYKELGAGLAWPALPEYIRLLHERYRVEHVRVAGCVVSKPLRSYIIAYNEVITLAARRRFGRDVFGECARDAVRRRQQP
jgi:hypothetical protein